MSVRVCEGVCKGAVYRTVYLCSGGETAAACEQTGGCQC